MDRERVEAWLAAYRRAWEEADARAIPGMVTQEASYRAHPLGMAPHRPRRHRRLLARATAGQQDVQDPRFGTPFVSGSGAAAAVEWWTTMLEEDRPATLMGCSVLTFTPDGLVATGRDYWFLESGVHHPFDGWGR